MCIPIIQRRPIAGGILVASLLLQLHATEAAKARSVVQGLIASGHFNDPNKLRITFSGENVLVFIMPSATGTLPIEISGMTSLTFLQAYADTPGLGVEGAIPSQLGSLQALEKLQMYDTKLTGTLPPELSLLANLNNLYLDGGDLTGTLVSSLVGVFNVYGLLFV
jgi:hypothetical protein